MFHILVVDDDKHTRKLIEAVLKTENYTVYTAENGEEALAVIDREYIDLIVLDIMMPTMDGYEFTKALRENQNTLPISMVSAKQLPEDKREGFIVGTDDYMTKIQFVTYWYSTETKNPRVIEMTTRGFFAGIFSSKR